VIGASASDMQAIFGEPKLVVGYSFNTQRATHTVYQTRDGHTLSVYFVGDALTEITDVGAWSRHIRRLTDRCVDPQLGLARNRVSAALTRQLRRVQ
jgi:hypothetical protein